MPVNRPRVIWWIRTDLRLHDNVALHTALDLKPECLYPTWTWDPTYIYKVRVSPNRWRFLLDSQQDLSDKIKAKTGANGLLVLRGNPKTCLEQALKDWKITHLVFEKDTDTYARRRDKEVTEMAESMGIKVISVTGRTLWDPAELTEKHGGKPIMSITALHNCGDMIGPVPRPKDAPKSIPKAGDTKISRDRDDDIDDSPDVNENGRIEGTDKVTCYERMDGPDGSFAVPTMEELNMKEATSPHRGGETIALQTLADYVSDKKKTAIFEKPKTNPGSFLPPETTLLSPHLHFGTLSIRKFYWDVMDVVKAYGSGASKPPTSLEGQLLFRDMYFAAQYAVPNYEQTRGNPNCRYIPWRLMQTYDSKGDLTGQGSDSEAEEWLARWKSGTTGFPWIDAIQRQLIRDGWVHHLARHSVACFLTRGHLYIDWIHGAQHFEEHLLDHETACNVGNWQWLSCTAFFNSFYRVYSPVAFGKKWDKSGALIREYVPELRDVPEKFIYEPWKMSKPDQSKYGVIIGKDYPKPMIDVQEQAKICLAGMKAAYAAKLHGDHPMVMNGKARAHVEGMVEGGVGKREGAMDKFTSPRKKVKVEEKPESEDEKNEQSN